MARYGAVKGSRFTSHVTLVVEKIQPCKKRRVATGRCTRQIPLETLSRTMIASFRFARILVEFTTKGLHKEFPLMDTGSNMLLLYLGCSTSVLHPCPFSGPFMGCTWNCTAYLLISLRRPHQQENPGRNRDHYTSCPHAPSANWRCS